MDEGNSRSPLRSAAAIILLALGIVVCAMVLALIYQILFRNLGIPLLESLAAPERRSLSLPGQAESVVLPPIVFLVGSYGIVVGLLFVAASIGKTLVMGGITLLQDPSDEAVGKVLEQLHDQPIPVRIIEHFDERHRRET